MPTSDAEDARFLFCRMWWHEYRGAFLGADYVKCDRCGDEILAYGHDVVGAEIDHAIAGCNGSLRHFDPPAPLRRVEIK